MMKKTSFGLAALIFLLFTACSGNVKTTTNLTIPIDARALYNELAPRAADKDVVEAPDEFTIKLSINLYVNNNFFDSANTTITENTTQVELDFERVPVGAMVKATGLLEWDSKTANATSNTVKVEEYGTSLILNFDLTDGNGGNSGEEGGNDQPGDKDSLPVTSTFDVTTPDDVRIQITVTLPQTIYLNNGQINLSAKNAQTQETIPVTDAQLYYGGNKVTDSMYTYNDGLFSLKQSNKLVAPGDYQLYVTAGQSNSCASCIVDLEVQNKEYYEYSIEGMEDPDDLGIMIATDNQNLIADAVVVITGNPVLPDGEENASGYINNICESLANENYLIDLDLSQTGSNLNTLGEDYNNSFRECNSLQSIVLSENFTTIKEESFYRLENFKSFTIANTNDSTNIEPGAFKECESLESFNISGDGNKYYTAADGTVLLQRDESAMSSTILAASASFTDLNLADEEMFPDALNPDSINHITEIAPYAFYKKENLAITSFGDVTSIGDNAFQEASIPDLTIAFIPAENAFEEANITNLTVDCDVTRENVGDFKSFIESLERVTINSLTFNKNAYLSGNNIFSAQRFSLGSLTFKGNTEIGSGQFNGYYITELACLGQTQLGDQAIISASSEGIQTMDLSGVTVLGKKAIKITQNNLNEGTFTYPPAIESMSTDSFDMSDEVRNAITSFTIDQSNAKYGVILNGKGLVDKTNKTLFAIAKNNLTSVDFTDSGVETISSDPLANFEGCSDLEDVTLDGVKTIENGAFLRCPSLKIFVVPSSLESISALAFVSKRGDDNYNSETETKITNITCASNNENYSQIDNIMLVDKNKVLVLLAHTSTAALDFSDHDDDIDSIGTYACARHDEITSVDFTGIMDIQEAAFLDCYQLIETSIEWGLVEKIGYAAFTWSSSVYKYDYSDAPYLQIEFPSSLKRLEYAFGSRNGKVTDTVTSSIEITNDGNHPLALQEDALGPYNIKVATSNPTGMTLTLPSTGTWYYIGVTNAYDQDLLKEYVTSWVDDPTQFPIGNLTPPDEITITQISADHIYRVNTEDMAVDYLLCYGNKSSGYLGWLYFKPSN